MPLFEEFSKNHGAASLDSESLQATINCDGASSGNPGHAGIGVIIRFIQNPSKDLRISEYIGIATNNVAEYSALIRGLKEARSLGLETIAVFLDSELLVKQLSGEYKTKNPRLKALHGETRGILQYFKAFKINHIKRELNKEADILAKKAIKEKLS